MNLTFVINSDCSVDCQDNFELLLLYSDTVVDNITERVNEFSSVANLTASSNPISKTVTNTFIIQPEMDGFYLALRDYGACYRPQCCVTLQ